MLSTQPPIFVLGLAYRLTIILVRRSILSSKFLVLPSADWLVTALGKRSARIQFATKRLKHTE